MGIENDYLYVMQERGTGHIKVGRTRNPEQRLKAVQTGNSHEVRYLLTAEGYASREAFLHRYLSSYKVRKKGGSEWFHKEALEELPDDLYSLIAVAVLEDPDWWVD